MAATATATAMAPAAAMVDFIVIEIDCDKGECQIRDESTWSSLVKGGQDAAFCSTSEENNQHGKLLIQPFDNLSTAVNQAVTCHSTRQSILITDFLSPSEELQRGSSVRLLKVSASHIPQPISATAIPSASLFSKLRPIKGYHHLSNNIQ